MEREGESRRGIERGRERGERGRNEGERGREKREEARTYKPLHGMLVTYFPLHYPK